MRRSRPDMALDRFTQLVLFKAYADLRSESARTYIGVAWWVLDPVIYMAVFYLVFEKLLDRGGPDFVQYLLVGLVFFRWFSNTVGNGSQSIRAGHALMQQVYLPKTVFPLVTFASDSFKFLITLLLLLAFLWISGYPPSLPYLALVPLLAVQTIVILGGLFIGAAITPVIPDFRFIVQHGLTLLLFLSGIFYYPEQLPAEVQRWFYLNPMASLITGYRDVLLADQWPDVDRITMAAATGLLLLLPGYAMIRTLDTRYPKIVRTRGL